MNISGRTIRIIGGALLGGGLLILPVTLIEAQEWTGRPADSGAKPAAAAAGAAAGAAASASGATYVGSASCKACHADMVKSAADSAHGKALARETLPAELRDCEACHGPASLHVSSGGKTKPFVPRSEDPQAANAACSTCHLQTDATHAPKEWRTASAGTFTRSMHGRKGVACVDCHNGHPTGNEKQLVKPASELCLSCHGAVMERSPGKKAAYTHSPVAEGMCLTCHAPHGSTDRTMLVRDIQKACLDCHDVEEPEAQSAHKGFPVADSNCAECHDPHSHDPNAKLVRTRKHAPFKQGNCETCHSKPVAGQPVALVKSSRELCMTCHPASKLMADGEHKHKPVEEGMCLTCHSPHASREKALLKTRASNTCFTCHNKIETATMESHRHQVFDANLNCMACHKPHSSTQEKLLVKEQSAMCGQCHKHSFSHPIGKKADGTPVLDPTSGDPMDCASCHDIHGSRHEAMTIADKSRDLCVVCHRSLETST